MTTNQAESLKKIEKQLAGYEKEGTAKILDRKEYDGDILIFANLTRDGETRHCSFRICTDGAIKTHLINTFSAKK